MQMETEEVSQLNQEIPKAATSANEELLDYEDEAPLSNDSNSAQRIEEGELSSGGSTVYEKSPKNSEQEAPESSSSSKVISIKKGKRQRQRSSKHTKRKRRHESSSGSSTSSCSEDDSEAESSSESIERKRSRKKVNKRKKMCERRKIKGKRHGTKRRRQSTPESSSREMASSSSDEENGTKEKEIRGLTKEKLQKMFSEYYDNRKAEEKKELMKAVPDTAGQLQISQNLRDLSINPGRSETTIYTRAVKSRTKPESNSQGKNPNVNPSQGIRKDSSDSDNLMGGSLGMFNSSDDSISPPGQRMLPKPPMLISDDIALAEAMNRPEWTKAIDKAREEADRVIRKAEANKVRMVKPTGENNFTSKGGRLNTGDLVDTLERHRDTDRCDEVERLLSSHLDESTKLRIQKGEFLELHKLVFKDKAGEVEQGKVKVTNVDGDTYYIPPSSESNSCIISNFRQWKRCFRIYAEVYATANPSRAGDISQYMDSIETASGLYTWENVAKYDIKFRRHMAKYKHRKWSDCYTKAYEESMMDPLSVRTLLSSVKKQTNFSGGRKHSNACWRFNKHDKCNLGAACATEHKCSFCGKFGHSKKICHRFKQQQSDGQGNRKPDSRSKEWA